MRAFGASENAILAPTVQCPNLFLHHANVIAGVPVFSSLESGRRTIRQPETPRDA